MRLLGSFGVIIALLGNVLAEQNDYDEMSNATDARSSIIASSKAAATATSRGTTASNSPNRVNKRQNLSNNQVYLLNNWGQVKKTSTLARKLGLYTAWRITLLLPKKTEFNLNGFGPNIKLELLTQLMGILRNTKPDSPNAIYSDLPPEYATIVAQGTTTTTTTKTDSSSSSSSRPAAAAAAAVSTKSTAVEETVEEGEQ
ncbi:hypothetical protein NEMIN01_0176 [Nematocida minor]|uniref:uncharacterized protein n=1 Tax=Nematocida minor TaxID=1912983 RepID=UPI002220BB82|nr:uncharacterized protein NEMIN01_0072 [Nematocida minor]XP_051332078.1 uncharacterized protein NEMIN01_0176 [Nematocida minor]KAI5188808.1 hypothetical protein NEMIN01_0072 [Nematocida minor]KAI5188912.1 hypothetical protein NEMIN01_0176 [Nematocida minor]